MSTTDFLRENILLYPNPTSTFFTLSVTNNLTLKKVEVYNLVGKRVLNTTSETLDVSSLTSGVYFARITTDKGQLHVKVIKK